MSSLNGFIAWPEMAACTGDGTHFTMASWNIMIYVCFKGLNPPRKVHKKLCLRAVLLCGVFKEKRKRERERGEAEHCIYGYCFTFFLT